MSILVAGETGFVGRNLVPVLLANGHDLRVLTRRPSPRTDGAVEVLRRLITNAISRQHGPWSTQ